MKTWSSHQTTTSRASEENDIDLTHVFASLCLGSVPHEIEDTVTIPGPESGPKSTIPILSDPVE